MIYQGMLGVLRYLDTRQLAGQLDSSTLKSIQHQMLPPHCNTPVNGGHLDFYARFYLFREQIIHNKPVI